MFRFLFNFYIEASIHVALAVFSLYYVFSIVNQLPYDEALGYTLFYGTITAYNFVKFATVAKLHHRSLTKSLRLIQVFSLLCFFILLYYIVQLPVKTLIVFGCGGGVVLAYVFPFYINKNLRSIGMLKIYVVAFCWALAIIIASIVHYQLTISTSLSLEALQVFVLIVALIIPFDIRDLKYDGMYLQTIPQKLGIKKSKILACLLLFIYLGIDFFLKEEKFWMATLVSVLIAIFLILKMPKKPVKYYCSFGIESVPILKLITTIFNITYF